ncbi:Malic enzyme, NAD-binding protein [Cordyceps fumosorosea ARSEF 2679]|uniref:Malic enzyme n=1 Tax=Cordyceps fumosorosea (strain ARSEF 2679) TaxID=1081104 RepID=A0A168E3F3_CORFA|nr:Malic enzyme, NAD-binding protein [Cordyceps fumosorosea ARSEF 2679]OAA73330.1 Malic enzyme, NAD-binding protein [Cordyceps fumosorosea ARSEF 2679]
MSAAEPSSRFSHLPRAASDALQCSVTGPLLLSLARYNKGSAFPDDERKAFALHGLLPPKIQTLEEQADRAYQQYSSCGDDLSKNTFMASMKVQNEVLYYKLLQTHLKEMFSIIYTPTEADAIQNYSRLFRKPEGCFLNIRDQDAIDECLAAYGNAEDIDYIVVSDGEEQILGIGDQGVGAILISAAKLTIATLCAGIHPSRQLPVVLDCGTNATWIRGSSFIFIDFASEDFGIQNAKRILDRYQSQIPCFNDDIQGTGCVTVAAILAALHVSDVKVTDVRAVIFGSGTAGMGIADQLADTIARQADKSREDARKQIWCIDKLGLLLKSHGDKLTASQAEIARDTDEWSTDKQHGLLSVIQRVKPHVLVGTSTVPNAFDETVIREMAKHVQRPIVFPLSNPTRLHEARPKDLFTWTDGKALVATAECNNSTCFPGIGLGAVLSRSRLVSRKMLVAAVEALKLKSPALGNPARALLPDVQDVREVSVEVAAKVIQCAVEENLAQEKDIPRDDGELREWIRAQMWDAAYRPLVKQNVKN